MSQSSSNSQGFSVLNFQNLAALAKILGEHPPGFLRPKVTSCNDAIMAITMHQASMYQASRMFLSLNSQNRRKLMYFFDCIYYTSI